MKREDLNKIWDILRANYSSLPLLSPESANAWMEFIGWCDGALMEKAAIEYCRKGKYVPKAADLIFIYKQLYAGKEAESRVLPEINCKYCRGNGWVKIITNVVRRTSDNGCWDIYDSQFAPCGCCTPAKGHTHKWWQTVQDTALWIWDAELWGFCENKEWMIGGIKVCPGSTKVHGSNMEQLHELFAAGVVRQQDGLNRAF